MSKLKDQLNKIVERVNELEKNPSELTKDALLAEVIGFYDLAKSSKLTTVVKAPPLANENAANKPVEPVKPTAEKIDEPKPVAKTDLKTPQAEKKQNTKKEPLIGKTEPNEEVSNKKILAGQFNKEPLTDLRSGIPLNEKFGIIRTLFKGNASDFGDAVLKLNNAANTKEMTHYLELLSQRFEWDVESNAYATFYGYINRKMMTLEPSNSNTD